MATITKEKNYVIITNDKGYSYQYNINDGTLTAVKTGNVIHSMPKYGVSPMIYNIAFDFNWKKNNPFIQAFCDCVYRDSLYAPHNGTILQIQIIDKLNSIGYDKLAAVDIDICHILSDENYFKKFAKAFKNDSGLALSDFVRNCAFEDFLKALNVNMEEDERITTDMVNKIFDLYRDSYDYYIGQVGNREDKLPYDNCFKHDIKNCSLLLYYMIKYDNAIKDITNVGTASLVNTYINMCKELNIEPEKGDLMRLYPQVRDTYLLYKHKADNEKIVKNLARFPLFFEDESYIVKIPQDVNDFREEAESQHNCVYRLYMGKVMQGITNVVFIRKKSDPAHSYITCEVKNDGIINQYLAHHNTTPCAAAIEFKTKYQQYLTKAFAALEDQ